MTRHNIPLGRISRIPIALDDSWFVVFGLLTWMLATHHYPAEFKAGPQQQSWNVAAVTAIMLFVSVLLHELGHCWVALRYKLPVTRDHQVVGMLSRDDVITSCAHFRN